MGLDAVRWYDVMWMSIVGLVGLVYWFNSDTIDWFNNNNNYYYQFSNIFVSLKDLTGQK